MTFSLVDVALFTALVATTASVLLVHRRLRVMGRMLAEYQAASEASARALDRAVLAVGTLNAESRLLVSALNTQPAMGEAGREDSGGGRQRLQIVRPANEPGVIQPRF